MKKIMIAGMVAGMLALTGCSYGGVKQEKTADGLTVENSQGGGSVSVVEVPYNGSTVTCAMLVGYSKGGISCDWDSAK